jgi:energy-coupling factor transport system permease protein
MKNVWVTRLKLSGLLACSTGILFIRDIRVLFIVAAVITGLSLFSSEATRMRERIVPIFTICAFVIIFQLICNGQVSLLQRIYLGLASSTRLLALSLLVFLFAQTTSVSRIIEALSFLPGNVRLMITISFALIPAIMQETTAIRMAQQARGLRHQGIHIMRSLLPLLIPLLNRTLSRAEHIAMIMEARGYASGA